MNGRVNGTRREEGRGGGGVHEWGTYEKSKETHVYAISALLLPGHMCPSKKRSTAKIADPQDRTGDLKNFSLTLSQLS